MRFSADSWLFALLAVPLVAFLWALGAVVVDRSRKKFGHPDQVAVLVTNPTALRRTTSAILVTLAVALGALAAAGPQYGRGTRILPATNLDVVLVLDYSKSMYARDVTPSRIERAKIEVARLAQKLGGARLGAVAFAGEPLAFPLTSDGAAIAQFFRGLEPNDMPVGGTAIARALEAGRELFARDPLAERHEKVLVLVTDGEDLEGDPIAAARTLAELGIRVEVVQIGGRSPEPIPLVLEDGSTRGLRRDASGNVLTTALSAEGEKQLAGIAEATRGKYHQAGQGRVGIDEIAESLRALMTEELSERVETVFADVYHYPLALALLLLFVEVFVGTSKKRAPPAVHPRGERKKRVPKRLRATAVLLALGSFGCVERFDPLFERESPIVNDAIEALQKGDAARAEELLVGYLETGPCEAGVIGAGERARTYGDAAYDLGLAFAKTHDEKNGKKDPSAGGLTGLPFPTPNAPNAPGTPNTGAPKPAADAALIECGLRLLGPLADDDRRPAALRARALYLMGNLEMRRDSFRAAISAYDRGLSFAPAHASPKPASGPDGAAEPEAFDPIGRDLAHNRAVALRRALEKEEQEKKEKQKNQSEEPEKNESDPKDDPNANDPGSDPEDEKDDSEKSDEDSKDDPNADQKKPGESPETDPDRPGDDQEDPRAEKKGPGEDPNDPSDEGESQAEADPGSTTPGEPSSGHEAARAGEAAQGPSVSQDERLLDLLEQAPTLQQHDAKRRAGRGGRRTMEDK